MENLYLYIIIALAILAIADLIVGVSNDAVNFLNSAIGSKAISFRTIMVVASLGIVIGAVFSSGMMEVARKGIFNPGEFMFNEIMIIFLAVMITDILLLDFFNTLGLPTSTTVSIVFELLGAAVCMALIKIGAQDEGTFSDLVNYINTSKATQIIFGILLSVFVAFSIGALVQWISRVLLSYNYLQKPSWVGALFGGFALTALTYFIFMKGIKGTPYANESFTILGGATIKDFLEQKVTNIILVSLAFWFFFSYFLIKIGKVNIYKVIIIVGTFALALAFAGNDLVNFIGVPMAAYNSYEFWLASGVDPTSFPMDVLASKVKTNSWLLVLAGTIMVLTLWFSSKARAVVKTSIDLSSQSADTKERFHPNFLSRTFVRSAMAMSSFTSYLLPQSWHEKIEAQFKVPAEDTTIAKIDRPAFDMVRASVNLMVAAVLISVATSYKLPLSTTYVTFMVAMGTSLADRAWGAESAVYRVAGVLNVIAGWFFTALSAFLVAGLVAFLLNLNIAIMFPILFITVIALLTRSTVAHSKKIKGVKQEDSLVIAESRSVQGVIKESAKNIANVVKRGNKIYTNAIDGLAKQDLKLLKKTKKQVVKLSEEVDDLRDNIFYFIKNLDESSVSASNFYINILGYLQDMIQSLEYISKASFKHINNNHKKLKFTQIKELKLVDNKMSVLFNDMYAAFNSESFEQIGAIINEKKQVYQLVKEKIQAQVDRTRKEESSPKNTTLYFSLLLETKDLINAIMNLLEEYNNAYDSNVLQEIQEEE